MKGKVNIMIEFDLLKALGGYILAMRELSMPILICRPNFEVITANNAAQNIYPGLTALNSIKILFEEYDTNKLREELERLGTVSISDMVTLDDVKIVLMPLMQDEELLAIALLFDRGQALPANQSINYKSKTADTLANGLRTTMDGMFRSLDALVQRSDLLGMEWVTPYADQISTQGYQTLRIATNVTEYVRLQNGELRTEPYVFNIAAWLEEIRETIAEISKTAGVSVHSMIPHEDSMVMADILHFELAFFNILHNAIYYTKPGNKVFIALRNVSGGAEITVQDSGLGIPEDILPHVTEPYFSYSHGRNSGGAGLGLTLAARIITTQGGKLSINSESGEGTRVVIFMPERDFSASLTFAQNEQSTRNRFSPLYIGLAGVGVSPYKEN